MEYWHPRFKKKIKQKNMSDQRTSYGAADKSMSLQQIHEPPIASGSYKRLTIVCKASRLAIKICSEDVKILMKKK